MPDDLTDKATEFLRHLETVTRNNDDSYGHHHLNLEDIPEETIQFLTELRKKDIEDLKEGIAMIQTIKTVSKFLRWTILTLIGTFITLVAFWNAIEQAKVFFIGFFK